MPATVFLTENTMRTSSFILLFLIIIAIAGGSYYFSKLPAVQNANAIVPALTAIEVQQPNLVVTGNNLSDVEIWAVPTGKNITKNDYIKLGDAALASPPGLGETWIWKIPNDPVLANQIFARGLNDDGTEAGRVFLPYATSSTLYSALWASPSTAH